MPKTCKLILILAGLSMQCFGQVFDKKAETERLLNSILSQDTISNNIFEFTENIRDFDFEGNYSFDRLFPGQIKRDSTGKIDGVTRICVSPLEFESPIYKVLQRIDSSY